MATRAPRQPFLSYDALVALCDRILDLGDSPEELMESADLVGDCLEELGEPATSGVIAAVRDHMATRL